MREGVAAVKLLSDNHGVAFDNLSLEHSSTVDRVADELRRALFDGELDAGHAAARGRAGRGHGSRALDDPRGPAVLVGEGLATREPNRGVHVTELDPDARRGRLPARTVLETAGVRRWAEASERVPAGRP